MANPSEAFNFEMYVGMLTQMAQHMPEPTKSVLTYFGGINYDPKLDKTVCKVNGKAIIFHVLFSNKTVDQDRFVLLGEGIKSINWEGGSPEDLTTAHNARDRRFFLHALPDEINAVLKFKFAKVVSGKLVWQTGDNNTADLKQFGHIAFISVSADL